jgi:hypothetical protein
LKSGYGEMIWADKSMYKGFWKEGNQCGIGIIHLADGTEKAGTFENNTMVEAL